VAPSYLRVGTLSYRRRLDEFGVSGKTVEEAVSGIGIDEEITTSPIPELIYPGFCSITGKEDQKTSS